jgi:hypothetical protein
MDKKCTNGQENDGQENGRHNTRYYLRLLVGTSRARLLGALDRVLAEDGNVRRERTRLATVEFSSSHLALRRVLKPVFSSTTAAFLLRETLLPLSFCGEGGTSLSGEGGRGGRIVLSIVLKTEGDVRGDADWPFFDTGGDTEQPLFDSLPSDPVIRSGKPGWDTERPLFDTSPSEPVIPREPGWVNEPGMIIDPGIPEVAAN